MQIRLSAGPLGEVERQFCVGLGKRASDAVIGCSPYYNRVYPQNAWMSNCSMKLINEELGSKTL